MSITGHSQSMPCWTIIDFPLRSWQLSPSSSSLIGRQRAADAVTAAGVTAAGITAAAGIYFVEAAVFRIPRGLKYQKEIFTPAGLS